MTDQQAQALLPHEQRVVDEKKELDERLAKLRIFFGTQTFHSLSTVEQGLMQRQCICMNSLSLILGERIDLFLKRKP